MCLNRAEEGQCGVRGEMWGSGIGNEGDCGAREVRGVRQERMRGNEL